MEIPASSNQIAAGRSSPAVGIFSLAKNGEICSRSSLIGKNPRSSWIVESLPQQGLVSLASSPTWALKSLRILPDMRYEAGLDLVDAASGLDVLVYQTLRGLRERGLHAQQTAANGIFSMLLGATPFSTETAFLSHIRTADGVLQRDKAK